MSSTHHVTQSQNTPANPATATQLVFMNGEDPMNSPVTIDKKVYMKIKNTADRMSVTRVVATEEGKDNDEVLGMVKHALLLYDTVQFKNHYDGKTSRVRNWLKETKLNGRRRWTMQTSLGELCWVVGAVPNRDERLLLVASNNPEKRYAWIKTTAVNKEPYHLYVAEGTEPIHEIIILSFGVVEEAVRMKGLDNMPGGIR